MCFLYSLAGNDEKIRYEIKSKHRANHKHPREDPTCNCLKEGFRSLECARFPAAWSDPDRLCDSIDYQNAKVIEQWVL